MLSLIREFIEKKYLRKKPLKDFLGDPYKIDLISRMDEADTVISCYTQGDFTDLCRGPHVETTKMMKYFKLLKFWSILER